MSMALRWYGSMASKCDSFIFSNLETPNVNKSCLHFVIDGSPFDLQYLLTSFANIEYKCDICALLLEGIPGRKRCNERRDRKKWKSISFVMVKCVSFVVGFVRRYFKYMCVCLFLCVKKSRAHKNALTQLMVSVGLLHRSYSKFHTLKIVCHITNIWKFTYGVIASHFSCGHVLPHK